MHIFIFFTYASPKSHKVIRQINIDYQRYRLLSTATMVTLVTETVINVRRSSCKVPAICVRFQPNMTFFSTDFSKNHNK